MAPDQKALRSGAHKKIERCTVLILGAGLAGVAAAQALHEAGIHDMILLEASDRIGGRMKAVQFAGTTVEAGANWIHGVENGLNPLSKIANDCKLQRIRSNYFAFTARDSTGREVTGEVKREKHALHAAVDQTHQLAEEMGLGDEDLEDGARARRRPSPSDASVETIMRSASRWRVNSPSAMAAEYFMFDSFEALPMRTASMRGSVYRCQEEYFGNEDEFVYDQRGFATIATHLADQVFGPGDTRLRLRQYVTSVHLPPEMPPGVPADEGVFVKTACGGRYWAKYCIVTFPNAVLLSGRPRFEPPLPVWKTHALGRCETVVFDKIFVKFSDDCPRFWDPSEWLLYVDTLPVRPPSPAPSSASSNSDERDGPAYKASTRRVSLPFSSQLLKTANSNAAGIPDFRNSSPAVQEAQKNGVPFTRGYFTVWQSLDWLHFERAAETRGMMMVTLVGDMARDAEKKSEGELALETREVLRRMYGDRVPLPQAVHCTRWAQDPLALGSFHCARKGLTPTDAEALEKPVRNLRFAGDGAGMEFVGYLNGALHTGRVQARAVAEALAEDAERVKQVKVQRIDTLPGSLRTVLPSQTA